MYVGHIDPWALAATITQTEILISRVSFYTENTNTKRYHMHGITYRAHEDARSKIVEAHKQAIMNTKSCSARMIVCMACPRVGQKTILIVHVLK